MRKKIVWFIYVAYLMIIGIAAFGSHDMRINRDLAGIALKSPVMYRVPPEDRPQFDLVDGMSSYDITYKPNVGGFIVWAGSGAIVAHLLQGKSDNKKKEQSA